MSSINKKTRDLSITIVSFYMRIAGFWLSKNYAEERRRKFARMYSLSAVVIAGGVEIRDLYFSWGNFSVSEQFNFIALQWRKISDHNLETNRDFLATFTSKCKREVSSVARVRVLSFNYLIIGYCVHHVQRRNHRSSSS